MTNAFDELNRQMTQMMTSSMQAMERMMASSLNFMNNMQTQAPALAAAPTAQPLQTTQKPVLSQSNVQNTTTQLQTAPAYNPITSFHDMMHAHDQAFEQAFRNMDDFM